MCWKKQMLKLCCSDENEMPNSWKRKDHYVSTCGQQPHCIASHEILNKKQLHHKQYQIWQSKINIDLNKSQSIQAIINNHASPDQQDKHEVRSLHTRIFEKQLEAACWKNPINQSYSSSIFYNLQKHFTENKKPIWQIIFINMFT